MPMEEIANIQGDILFSLRKIPSVPVFPTERDGPGMRMIEPIPTEEILAKYPDQYDLLHRPDFLVVKVAKTSIR